MNYFQTFPQTNDLYIFLVVVKNQSFTQAADALGFSRAYISKHIQALETSLGYKLLYRTTRSIELTPQGEKTYQWAQEILLNVQRMTEDLTDSSNQPRGHLTITSSLGFGRKYLASLLSDFIIQYPDITLRFNTIDKIQDLITQHVDLDIHIGNHIAPDLIAKKLADNYRILCASPSYLNTHGTPLQLSDLLDHNCLLIEERDTPYSIWKFTSHDSEQQIKVAGKLSSNNGELVRQWALNGHGIMLRSIWDIHQELNDGKLIRILNNYWQDADIWAIYPTRLNNSAKLKSCVHFLASHLPKTLGQIDSDHNCQK